jgi:hypothetical protein
VTATELEVLACLGVEPQMLDSDVPWCYNDAAYLVEVDGLSVSFAVAPGFGDVRLIVRRGDQRLFEFSAVGVRDVRVIDEPGVDAVEVVMAEESWLRLQLRPAFEVTQGFRSQTPNQLYGLESQEKKSPRRSCEKPPES